METIFKHLVKKEQLVDMKQVSIITASYGTPQWKNSQFMNQVHGDWLEKAGIAFAFVITENDLAIYVSESDYEKAMVILRRK